MSSLTIQLSEDTVAWLREEAARSGQSQEAVASEQIEKARAQFQEKPWMRLAGSIKGLPPDLSTKEGFGPR